MQRCDDFPLPVSRHLIFVSPSPVVQGGKANILPAAGADTKEEPEKASRGEDGEKEGSSQALIPSLPPKSLFSPSGYSQLNPQLHEEQLLPAEHHSHFTDRKMQPETIHGGS